MTSGTAGGNAGDAVRKGVGMFHGAGEAIRGNINAFVDKATGDQESAARHEVIASRGVDEMKNGYQSRTTAGAATTNRSTTTDPAGVQPDQSQGGYYAPQAGIKSANYEPSYPQSDFYSGLRCSQADGTSPDYELQSTDTGKKATSRSGSESRGSTSSNYGPHSTNLGKKLDSFVDSDHGHRSAPSNYGPHSTNPGNKLNPRYDSDCDHCGAHGGNIGSSTFETAAREFISGSVREHTRPMSPNHSFNHYPEHRDQYGQGDYDHRSHRDPDQRGQYGHDHYPHQGRDQYREPHVDQAEPHIRATHRSNNLNGLDPRIDIKHDHYYDPPYRSNFYSSFRQGHNREPSYKLEYGERFPRHQDYEVERSYYQDHSRGPPYHQDYPPSPSGHQYRSRDSFDRPVYYLRRYDSAPNGPFTSAYEDADRKPAAKQTSPQESAVIPAPSRQQPRAQPQPASNALLPLLPAQGHKPAQSSGSGGSGGEKHAPHAHRVMNVLDPRVSVKEPKGAPHSTEYPHKAGWLNLLDPRVDRGSVRKGEKEKEQGSG